MSGLKIEKLIREVADKSGCFRKGIHAVSLFYFGDSEVP